LRDIKYLKNYLNKVLAKTDNHNYVFLFLDYDGTLVEIKKTPQKAIPSPELKKIILKLDKSKNIITTIVSGRSIRDLLNFFGNLSLKRTNWVGSHGAEIKYPDSDIFWVESVRKSLFYIKKLKEKIARMLKDIPCYHIEDKEVSFAIHYRNCGPEEVKKISEIVNLLDGYKKKFPIDYMDMKKVIEVKPPDINKGKSVSKIKNKYCNALNLNIGEYIVICIGDDVTDEYMFMENMNGINIKVASDESIKSKAEYYLKTVSEVHDFLKKYFKIEKF